MHHNNYWDILPNEIQDKIIIMATRLNKTELNIEIHVELVAELTSEHMWVDRHTMYEQLVITLYDIMHKNNMPIYIVQNWTRTLDTGHDVSLQKNINSLLNAWNGARKQFLGIYSGPQSEKIHLDRFNKFYFTNIMVLFPYQTLLSLKRLIINN